jgi:hypothetical protein
MKSFLNSYLSSLTDSRDLANIRLVVHEEKSLSYALLNLQIKWLEFKMKVIEEILK